MLGGIRRREGELLGERFDGSFGLREKLEDFEAVRIRERPTDAGVLGVQAVLERDGLNRSLTTIQYNT